jgi:hypothetical protein
MDGKRREISEQLNRLEEDAPETILGKCCRPRPRLVCVDGEAIGLSLCVDDMNGKMEMDDECRP